MQGYAGCPGNAEQAFALRWALLCRFIRALRGQIGFGNETQEAAEQGFVPQFQNTHTHTHPYKTLQP